jgi:hypothetical protein
LARGYGGFFFEPIILPNSPIHVSFQMLFGAGGLTTIPQNYWEKDLENYPYYYDIYFVFEPCVEVKFLIW